MSVLWIAVPVSLSLAALAVVSFLWALRDGQLDDLETPALRPLLEDASSAAPHKQTPAAPPSGRESHPERKSANP